MTDSATTTTTPRMPESFTYDGETFVMVGEDDLLFAEVRAIEKATRRNMDQLAEDGEATTALQALTWVSIKRRRPTFRFADLDTVPMAAIKYAAPAAPEGEPVDPTQAAAQASAVEAPAAE